MNSGSDGEIGFSRLWLLWQRPERPWTVPKEMVLLCLFEPFLFYPLSNSSNHNPAAFLLSPRPHHIMTPGSPSRDWAPATRDTPCVDRGWIFLSVCCFLPSRSCRQISDVADFKLAESDCAAPLDTLYPARLGEHQSAIAWDDGYLTRCDTGRVCQGAGDSQVKPCSWKMDSIDCSSLASIHDWLPTQWLGPMPPLLNVGKALYGEHPVFLLHL